MNRTARAVGKAAVTAVVEPAVRPIARRGNLGWLWAALAGGLALVAGRRGRRAAGRGGLAAVLVSLAVNLLKPIVRRCRPGQDLRVPLVTRPATLSRWSFPSSHAATAAAFATGAAIELPALAVPLAGAAAMVGYSRTCSRAHRPIDVVTGAAIGIAVAVGSLRVWPRLSSRGAPEPRRPVSSSPVGAGEGLVIVANPDAGPALRGSPADALRDAFPAARIHEVADGGDLTAALRRAADGASALGIVGGDGSVNAAAGVALEADVPLLVVPGGTLNHFARDVGLESVDDAVEAARHGSVLAVDVGLIGGSPFLNTASLGSYVELVDRRERLEGRLGKWLAAAAAVPAVLRRSQPVAVELDGRRRRLWMLFAGNCRYHPAGFAPAWREELDDGLLDLRAVDAEVRWSRLRLVVAVLTGRIGRCRAYQAWTTGRVTVKAPTSIRLARDGETFNGSPEFVVEKAPRRLRVFAPVARS